MKNLLDSIWEPEDDNATIGIQMIQHCIVLSCGGPPPTDKTMNGTICEA